MKKLLPRRLTTAGLLSLICLTVQLSPVPVRGSHAAPQTKPALAESLPESDLLFIADYKRVFDEAIPRILADHRELREHAVKAFEEVAAITGLDLRVTGRVVTGVRTVEAAGGKEPTLQSSVSLVRGVDQEKWLAFVRQKRPDAFRESRHGSKTLQLLRLTMEEKRAIESVMVFHALGEEGLAFAALDADTLAYGTPAGVRRAIDARAGSESKISAELVAAAMRNPDALFSASGLVPKSLTADLMPGGKGQENELAAMFSNVSRSSLAVELAPAGFTSTLTFGVGSPEQAKAMADVLTAFKTLSPVFTKVKTTRDRAGLELLKSLAVSTEGAEVYVKSQVPELTVRTLLTWSVSELYAGIAEEHKNKGELDAALANYNKALAADPENVQAYISRGQVHTDKGDLESAEADDTKALTLDPENVTAYNNRGFDRLRRGNHDGAIADFDKALSLDPSNSTAYHNRGYTLAEMERYDEALVDYDKAIALGAENADAYNNRANLHNALGDYAKAVADFDKAVALDPGMVNAYNGRGYAQTVLGEYDAAIADHSKAIALDPNSSEAYNGRGLAYYHKEEYDAAVADYDKSIALNPTPHTYLYANRGFARADRGDYTAALTDFDKAITLDSKGALGYHGRGYVRYKQGQYATAVADFDKAVAIEPERAETYGYRGLALLAQKKDAAAARDLKKCFELDESLKDFFEELAKEVMKSRRSRARRAY